MTKGVNVTKVIGLTGGIATGKSTVSALLRQRGALILDADLIAREIVEPGEEAWKEIKDTFGEQYLQEDQHLNRIKLGALVFTQSKALVKLNHITHPRIKARIKERLKAVTKKKKKPPLVVLDAALLLETGLDELVEEVWLVYCSKEEQIKRLMARNNLDYHSALARIEAQKMPLQEKKIYAQVFIDNNNSKEETEKQINLLWEKVIRGNGNV